MPVPSFKDQVRAINNDLASERLRNAILQLGANEGADVPVIVIALADVLGIVAGKQDAEFGERGLDDRLMAFCQRVEETYIKYRNNPRLKT